MYQQNVEFIEARDDPDGTSWSGRFSLPFIEPTTHVSLEKQMSTCAPSASSRLHIRAWPRSFPARQLGMWLASLWLAAAPIAQALPAMPVHGEADVHSKGKVTIDGHGKLDYDAEAGLLPILDDTTGRLMASVFYVSYSTAPTTASPRPITFVWNGGPGSNSAQLHMGVGPKRLDTADRLPDWTPSQSERPLVNNADSWLGASDLVFVDPVGSGYSRAVDAKDLPILYSSHGDAEVFAEAIRVYLTRHDAWNRPLYLAGESYGVIRAMLVAEALERRATPVRGVVLISYNFDLGTPTPAYPEDALNLPQFTAAAHYHQRLDPALQALDENAAVAQAQAWTQQEYLPFFANPKAQTTEARSRILAGLARFTGLHEKDIDPAKLTVSTADFADRLLADSGLELGRYDLRMTAPRRAEGTAWLPWIDPSLTPMKGLMNGTSRVFNRYLHQQLGFESDLLYRGPFGNAFHPQPLLNDPKTGFPDDWTAVLWNFDGMAPTGTDAPLRKAMDRNPQLRVLTLRGRYDGWPCESSVESTRAAEPRYASRITNLCLQGGHMWYSERASRSEGRHAFEQFLATDPPSSAD
ncbi:MAG: hypothetical protein QM601_11105 [Pseudoxanthomonas sp.]